MPKIGFFSLSILHWFFATFAMRIVWDSVDVLVTLTLGHQGLVYVLAVIQCSILLAMSRAAILLRFMYRKSVRALQ